MKKQNLIKKVAVISSIITSLSGSMFAMNTALPCNSRSVSSEGETSDIIEDLSSTIAKRIANVFYPKCAHTIHTSEEFFEEREKVDEVKTVIDIINSINKSHETDLFDVDKLKTDLIELSSTSYEPYMFEILDSIAESFKGDSDLLCKYLRDFFDIYSGSSRKNLTNDVDKYLNISSEVKTSNVIEDLSSTIAKRIANVFYPKRAHTVRTPEEFFEEREKVDEVKTVIDVINSINKSHGADLFDVDKLKINLIEFQSTKNNEGDDLYIARDDVIICAIAESFKGDSGLLFEYLRSFFDVYSGSLRKSLVNDVYEYLSRGIGCVLL